MRTRRTMAILGVGLILACCVMIYLMMDLTLLPPGQGPKLSMSNVRLGDTIFSMDSGWIKLGRMYFYECKTKQEAKLFILLFLLLIA